MIFSIALYPRWVSLFFLQSGIRLRDPAGLLEGSGNKVRHIQLRAPDQLSDPAVEDLIAQALELASRPINPAQPSRLIIQSVSAKQRPRRPAGRWRIWTTQHPPANMHFSMIRFPKIAFLCPLLALCSLALRADCNQPGLAHQQENAATIQRLETSWTLAYLTGDTNFERCLLTPDFTEIMSDGAIDRLRDELALAMKNRGRNVAVPPSVSITVHLHGRVAVAYGINAGKLVNGRSYHQYFADYYLWNDGAWHVFFAQQTKFPSS